MPERYLGQHLGRFRVDSVVGSGGFAWVYKGYDPELDIPVAIKVLKPQYAGEETFETRFRREASTAAKLRHPNIIRILAVGREGAASYFVMDFLPTGLDDRLRIMGTLPETLLIRLGMDVSAALAFAHREGVIHRDVKTDNILFDEHGNAIVADFGIARAVSGYVEQTGTNMVVGTPQYFSPEQARGQALDGRADVYSLGVTLFKAATGVLPFQGEDWYDIARQHVEEQPPRPRAFNPALSREVERVILKCLEKHPEDRYPTGDALHTELVQLLGRASTPETDQTVVIATPRTNEYALAITKPTRARRPFGVREATLAGIGVLGLLAIVLAAVRGGHAGPPTTARAAPPPTFAPAPAPVVPTPTPPPPPPAPPAAAAGSIGGPTLRISAPPEAILSVDDIVVGRGEWRSDTITAGMHRISAAIPGFADCRSARAAERVHVRASGTTQVHLEPRPCGSLVLDVEPADARWVIAQPGDDDVAHGVVPVASPIVLPAGSYTLRVSARFCADYKADFDVAAGRTHRERARLLCR